MRKDIHAEFLERFGHRTLAIFQVQDDVVHAGILKRL
ncbi:hypothetical protein AvCA_18410 [Azotobacter vinelandii CA]|uniref:Uncharacterized protein n=2 Tax=Azotobacter vinelandii TaxID=354 RepID=C1DDT2_AZOVD|nr:hypothetical protein Avin_18410 [Azotobacter vinelandii DJ]AGK15153.1 hypothetical protein AvCA_18410 [Azotobacter vinelandii CA]AGK20209.1 hypothetical protein AvCA6_18410 [Azotobacter vinelandii CA6]